MMRLPRFLFCCSLLLAVSAGRAAELADAPPQRILSLAPNVTEMLYFLGLGDRVVGVTQFSDYPPEARRKPKVGSFVRLNLERILSLKPDLAIGTADGNPAPQIARLQELGIPVLRIDPRTLPQMLESLVRIGVRTGVPDEARARARALRERIEALTARVRDLPKPLVFLQLSLKPLISANKNTYLNDLIERAGGRNLTRDLPSPYPRVSLETVLTGKPEILLILAQSPRAEKAARTFWPRWRRIPAVRNGRVYALDADLLTRPGPRAPEALERLIPLFHPELSDLEP